MAEPKTFNIWAICEGWDVDWILDLYMIKPLLWKRKFGSLVKHFDFEETWIYLEKVEENQWFDLQLDPAVFLLVDVSTFFVFEGRCLGGLGMTQKKRHSLESSTSESPWSFRNSQQLLEVTTVVKSTMSKLWSSRTTTWMPLANMLVRVDLNLLAERVGNCRIHSPS